MESVVTVFHGWKHRAREELDVAERGVEVEVAGRRSQGVPRCVAQCHPNAVLSTVDIFAYVAEERVVAAPVRLDLHVVDIDVRALVGVLEPQVGWLGRSERDGGVERERAFGVAGRVTVCSVDGIGRGDGVGAVSPGREVGRSLFDLWNGVSCTYTQVWVTVGLVWL